MNLKRFTGRTSRDALALVRQQFGADAVVMSTRPCPEGVEVLAMAPESVHQLEKLSAPKAEAAPLRARAEGRGSDRTSDRAADRTIEAPVDRDVEQLAMSTLSFQDYVRERMLKRRRSELGNSAPAASLPSAAPQAAATPAYERDAFDREFFDVPRAPTAPAYVEPAPRFESRTEPRAESRQVDDFTPGAQAEANGRRERQEMIAELRSMRGLIEQRFGALAFMEKLQRQPRQATLTQKLLDCGFSPALIRKLM